MCIERKKTKERLENKIWLGGRHDLSPFCLSPFLIPCLSCLCINKTNLPIRTHATKKQTETFKSFSKSCTRDTILWASGAQNFLVGWEKWQNDLPYRRRTSHESPVFGLPTHMERSTSARNVYLIGTVSVCFEFVDWTIAAVTLGKDYFVMFFFLVEKDHKKKGVSMNPTMKSLI